MKNKPEAKEYKGWCYQYYNENNCILVLPVNNKVVGFVGIENEIKEAIDLLCIAEETGKMPEDIGLNSKLAETILKQGNN